MEKKIKQLHRLLLFNIIFNLTHNALQEKHFKNNTEAYNVREQVFWHRLTDSNRVGAGENNYRNRTSYCLDGIKLGPCVSFEVCENSKAKIRRDEVTLLQWRASWNWSRSTWAWRQTRRIADRWLSAVSSWARPVTPNLPFASIFIFIYFASKMSKTLK